MKMLEQAGGKRPGAYKLLPWIRVHYGTIPAFCEAHGIDRIRVQKAIRGEVARFDVELAVALEHATKRHIVCADWIEVAEPVKAARSRRS